VETMISVTKIIQNESGWFALLSHEDEADSLNGTSTIQRIYEVEGSIESSSVLSTPCQMTDIHLTKTGVLWAVDALGHIHCSKPILNNTSKYPGYKPQSEGFRWSFEYVSDEVLSAIVGNDQHLWIATLGGKLLSFQNGNVRCEQGVENPIRMKHLSENHFLLTGIERQVKEYIDGQWRDCLFSGDIPSEIPINDGVLWKGSIFAVSISGHLIQKTKGNPFELVGYCPDLPFYSCDAFKGQLYFACGEKGIYGWDEAHKTPFLKKQKGQPIGAYAGVDRIFFPLADQEDGKVLLQKDPSSDAWYGIWV
jgi:hypothetical protein